MGLAFFAGIFGVASAHTQSHAPAAAKPATDPYHDEALVFERFDTTVRMHADGTGERVVHVVLRLQSEGAARQFGVLSVNYASAYETGAIDFIHVRKPDGTIVDTPTTDVIEMPAPVTREAPLYSDLKEKQVPVRSLAAGDVLDYQLHTVRTKAEAPGQFWGAEHFTVVGAVVLSETLTLETPAATYVQVWSPNHSATPAEHDGVRVWHWSSAQTKPSGRDKDGKMIVAAAEAHDPDQDADGRALPSVAWTTFHSWAEVGAWYRGLAAGRADPNDAVRAKADELTKDAKTPEEQTRALYRFVSTQVRYVGIDLGIGRYQPHPAAEVLATQYGDCKDKDTLLEALLHAKGFTTAPALIGVSIAPVAELPSPAVFNHVITTVEMPGGGGRIWLDATPEVDPYRELSAPIRDQQALVIPSVGAAALAKTPADPPFAFFERFTAVATLDKDGLLKGRMSMTVRSDNEPGFRTLLQRAASSQWDDAVQYVSNVMGFGGKVTNADLHQTDLSGPMQMAYDYSRPSFGDWDNRRIVPLFPALEIAGVDKEKAPEHDIDLGAPRTLEAHTEITLPAGFRADLPEPIHAKRPYSTFDQTYRLEGEMLVVDRHEILRSPFGLVDGVLVQYGPEPCEVGLRAADVSGASDPLAAAKSAASASCREAFDLAVPLRLRLTAYRLSAQDHVIVVIIDHLAADGMSLAEIGNAWRSFYQAIGAGTPFTAPAIMPQYRAFAAWQRDWLLSPDAETERGWWADQLRGYARAERAPDLHTGPFAARTIDFVLDKRTTARVSRLCVGHRLTPFMVILSAYALLLAALSGEDEILVATVRGNRRRPEARSAVGQFANLIPLLIILNCAQTADAYLRLTGETCRASYAHDALPFLDIAGVAWKRLGIAPNALACQSASELDPV